MPLRFFAAGAYAIIYDAADSARRARAKSAVTARASLSRYALAYHTDARLLALRPPSIVYFSPLMMS